MACIDDYIISTLLSFFSSKLLALPFRKGGSDEPKRKQTYDKFISKNQFFKL
jgi:hypothetical protein